MLAVEVFQPIKLDLATWAFLGGTIVPILVGLVTKLRASSSVKGLVNLVLTGVAGLIATVVATDNGILTQTTLVAWFMALIASVATYYGVLKPVGVTGAVQRSTANVGLGSNDQPPLRH